MILNIRVYVIQLSFHYCFLQFMPDDRKSAEEVIDSLKAVYPS